jgi:hypothetical protein
MKRLWYSFSPPSEFSINFFDDPALMQAPIVNRSFRRFPRRFHPMCSQKGGGGGVDGVDDECGINLFLDDDDCGDSNLEDDGSSFVPSSRPQRDLAAVWWVSFRFLTLIILMPQHGFTAVRRSWLFRFGSRCSR